MTVLALPASELSTSGQQPNDAGAFFRLSVSKYHAMIKAGILGPTDSVELLDGFLVTKMPKSPLHIVVSFLAREALEELFPKGSGWHVRLQDPITTDDSEPEPDLAVVRGSQLDYLTRHPTPEETSLVLEVSHSSLGTDRRLKLAAYARAGVPLYLILNVAQKSVERYSGATGKSGEPRYASVDRFAVGESVPVVVDGKAVGSIPVKALFP